MIPYLNIYIKLLLLLNIDESIIEDKDAVIKKLEQSVKKLKAKKSERKWAYRLGMLMELEQRRKKDYLIG